MLTPPFSSDAMFHRKGLLPVMINPDKEGNLPNVNYIHPMQRPPVLIADHLADAGAWLAAWLPGTEGDGVADVLFGNDKPTDKLSHTYPKTDAQATLIFSATPYDPLFKLGFGLTY